MKQFKSSLILFLICLVVSCQPKQNQNNDLSKGFEFKNETLLRFVQGKDTLTSHFEIELAESDYEKETGLMHRKEMKPNQGMLFIYDNEAIRPSFYMKNTLISLDLIYLDKHMKIVDFNLTTTPLSEDLIPSDVPSRYVLELKAGSVNRLKLEEGDQIILN